MTTEGGEEARSQARLRPRSLHHSFPRPDSARVSAAATPGHYTTPGRADRSGEGAATPGRKNDDGHTPREDQPEAGQMTPISVISSVITPPEPK